MTRTASPTLRPTPAALSNTMRLGTPATCSNMLRSAWHTHSAFSPGNTWAMPTLEYGKVMTKKLMRLRTPPT